MGDELFVYYRIAAGDRLAVQARVQRFQAQLMASHPGLQARLLVRSDRADVTESTLMETYRRASVGADDATGVARDDAGGDATDNGLTVACRAAIDAAAAQLAPWLCSPRHTEVFQRCD